MVVVVVMVVLWCKNVPQHLVAKVQEEYSTTDNLNVSDPAILTRLTREVTV